MPKDDPRIESLVAHFEQQREFQADMLAKLNHDREICQARLECAENALVMLRNGTPPQPTPPAPEPKRRTAKKGEVKGLVGDELEEIRGDFAKRLEALSPINRENIGGTLLSNFGLRWEECEKWSIADWRNALSAVKGTR